MDTGLKLILAKSILNKTIWRVKLTREDLEENRPNAVSYIKGAKDVEKDLTDVQIALDDLELELRLHGREINRCLHINGELKKRIEELEHELKFKDVEL
jgi:predicted nuclease with TOPRIM domain